MAKATPEMVNALRRLVQSMNDMWDASVELEDLVGFEVSCSQFEELAVIYEDESSVTEEHVQELLDEHGMEEERKNVDEEEYLRKGKG